jgi:hypothetical protein
MWLILHSDKTAATRTSEGSQRSREVSEGSGKEGGGKSRQPLPTKRRRYLHLHLIGCHIGGDLMIYQQRPRLHVGNPQGGSQCHGIFRRQPLDDTLSLSLAESMEKYSEQNKLPISSNRRLLQHLESIIDLPLVLVCRPGRQGSILSLLLRRLQWQTI